MAAVAGAYHTEHAGPNEKCIPWPSWAWWLGVVASASWLILFVLGLKGNALYLLLKPSEIAQTASPFRDAPHDLPLFGDVQYACR